MSVIVGFSQPTTPLLGPAPGTTKPDGTPADGSPEGASNPNLFAALLAMLTPGAQPDASAIASDPATVATPTSTALPPELPVAATPETPVPPELANLTKSEFGKALFKDFAAALEAAKQTLDDGKPLDPALEKKLDEAVAAIAAWFAGQPLLQPTTATDTSKISELASGAGILPSPAGEPAPTQPETQPADAGEPTPQTVLAKPVPDAIAELGDALKDIATQLEKTSPELAKALANLADRVSVGDIADDVLTQLGLTRTPESSTPELDQLVAALTAPKPATKAAAAPSAPIAVPTLEVPAPIAQSDTPEAKPEPAELKPAELSKPKLEAENPDDKPARDSKPAPAPTHADTKPPETATSATAAVDTSATPATAPTATTGTRAIHAAYSAPVQQLNLPQVAFEVARQFEAGNTRFQIRLDPPELGRIDVKLDLDKHGTVNAKLFVERPETLDLMMRDQRALQQALQQAGLDTGKTNLEFSLRQNPFAGTGADTGQGGGNGQPGFGPFGTPAPDESTEPQAQTLYRGTASASGLNLFV